MPSLNAAAAFSSPLSLMPGAGLALSPLQAPVVPVPALARPLPAAAAEITPNSAAPLEPAKEPAGEPASEQAPERAAANAGARFDGSVPAPEGAPVAVPKAALGSGLRMARSEHEAWLASVVELLAVTRTGRRVLRDIDALAARRGVPVLLDVKPIGNNGEFRYDSDLLVMDSGHLKRDPYQSAPILAHELQHVLQRDMQIPADALELEIESYTVESHVWTELGVEPEAGSFARDARAQLKKDLPGFVEWLGKQYKNNIPLYNSTMDSYVERLKKNLETARKAEAKTRRKIIAVERVLKSMAANGMSEEAITAHRQGDLEPLERSLRDGAVNRGWIERDLARLAVPEVREQFRAYARGVIRRARSLSRS